MELRQLEYFVAVAEEGSFTRAAERVRVAQPGVSAQIRRLERELGAELLDRSGRTVRLTEAGEAVLPYARAALAAVAGARLAVEELTGLLRGRVAVGTVTAHGVDLPGLLAAFHRDHPGVEITLTTATTDRLLEDLRGGRLDAAIVSIGEDTPPGVEIHVVEEQPIVAAVAPGHELADREVVPLAGLRGHALICLPPGTGVRARPTRRAPPADSRRASRSRPPIRGCSPGSPPTGSASPYSPGSSPSCTPTACASSGSTRPRCAAASRSRGARPAR